MIPKSVCVYCGSRPGRDAAYSDAAEAEIRSLAAARAISAGTEDAEISVTRELRTATVEGQRSFIEARLVATASGRPRIAQ